MNTAYLWLVLAIFSGLVASAIIFKFIDCKLAVRDDGSGISLKKRFYVVFNLLLTAFLLHLFIPYLSVSGAASSLAERLLSLSIIGLVGWVAVKAVYVGRDLVLSRYDIKVKDNLKARAIHTQMKMLVKITVIVIVVVTVASCLMIFDNVRQVGTSILASAGVIGIIIGFAAQKSIATLLAGLQLAITQPIRIDDVVIIDGEWGQIEEITLTYVVVRIWDLRRLVVPTSTFMEKSFQNWTRTSADLLGSVTFHVDYSLPVDIVRNQLHEIVKDHDLWDGKVWRLHVINATEKTVELRALVSAANSSDAWELRCDVREKLLSFLQGNYPGSLPRLRAEVLNSPD